MIRVGLTGGIASGKSTVAEHLRALGAEIIDADVLAREVVEPGTAGLARIRERFGATVIADGRLDRRALGAIVFADPGARRDLERIIHPAVRARAAELEAAAPDDAVVVHVIPLLVETGQQDSFDVVIVVDVEPQIQRDRLIRRDTMTAAEAEARIAAQVGRDERAAAATHLITNSGSVTELEGEIVGVWNKLRQAGAPG